MASSISAVLNVLLNFLLIPIISYNGAAITTLISEALILVIYIISSRKLVTLRINFRLVVSIAVGCLVIVLICFGIKSLVSNDAIIIFASIIVAVPIYFLFQIYMKNEIIVEMLHGFRIKVKNE